MRNLLLALVLANILYFLWNMFVQKPPETGVAIIDEKEMGPPLSVSNAKIAEASNSVGAVLGSGSSSDLSAVVGRSCVTVGPFKDNPEAEGAASNFESDGMRSSVRSTQGQMFVGHWVQIRNIPDKTAGDAMLDTLKSGGMGDAYLVNDDVEGYKISLGLFGEMSGAEQVELQAKSLDLPAEITPRMREATVSFVDIALPPGRGAGAIIEQYGEDKVLLRGKANCPRGE
jgi:hypothetical protein